MKNKCKKWMAILLCMVMAFTMLGTSCQVPNPDEGQNTPPSSSSTPTPGNGGTTPPPSGDNGGEYVPTIISTPSNSQVVNLLDGDILEYCSNYSLYKSEEYLPENYSETNPYRENAYAPKPVTLSWQSEGDAQYYTIKVATNKNLVEATTYITLDTSLELCDLFSGTNYYYQITANYADKTVKSQIFTFKTANLMRTIELEGVSNTRDIGGYYTVDGNRIRQGLVYRGGRLDDITEAAKKKALNVYGIKTVLSVRGDVSTPLGNSVNFVGVSGPFYFSGTNPNAIVSTGSTINSTLYRQALLTEIRTFAKAENYPIYVHCSLGRDRTGTLAFLINALCGVGEKDLYMDFEATFFSEIGCYDGTLPSGLVRHDFQNLYTCMSNYSTGTLAQNVAKFMLDLGVTQTEINTIRSIMIEEVA